MIPLKLFLLFVAILSLIYFLLYIRQLRIIKREIHELVLAKHFFVSFLMIILSAVFGMTLLISIGSELFIEAVF